MYNTRQLPDYISEAEAAFQAAIRLEPLRHDGYYNLGNLYLEEERYESAIEQYTQALRLTSNGPLIWLNLGLAARAVDQLQLSRYALHRSIQLDPKSIRSMCNYGITCHQLEQFDEAIKAYYLALSLDENHGPTLLNLGQALNASNRHPEAVGYLQAASSLTLQDDSGDALFNLALTRLLLGEYTLIGSCTSVVSKPGSTIHIPEFPRGIGSRILMLCVFWPHLTRRSWFGVSKALEMLFNSLDIYPCLAMGSPVLATRPLLVRLFKEWLQPEIPVIDDNQCDISLDSRHTPQ